MPCYTLLGQFIGFWGTLSDTEYYTNEVVVGATIQSDIAATFIDGDGIDNSGPNSFDYLELVRVDASQSKNYTSYAIAIQEFGGANRWRPGGNGGFMTGQVGVEDLTFLWENGFGWQFEQFNSYRLQIVIKNDNCPGDWIQTLPYFFICPQGQGCRLGHDNVKISISPNPASNRLTLTNLDITPKVSENYTLTIHELSGKEVKRFTSIRENEFDISDLFNGVYVVSLHNQKEGIFHEKLVITK